MSVVVFWLVRVEHYHVELNSAWPTRIVPHDPTPSTRPALVTTADGRGEKQVVLNAQSQLCNSFGSCRLSDIFCLNAEQCASMSVDVNHHPIV